MKKFDLIKDCIHSFENGELKENEEVSISGVVCNKRVGKVPSQPYTSVSIMYGNYTVYCVLDSYTFKDMFKQGENNLIGKFNEANSNLKIGKTVRIVGIAKDSTLKDKVMYLQIKKVELWKQ